jgi:uncharacterized protein
MYQTGRGAPQDYAQALAWYRIKAVNGRYYKAANDLGSIYENGRGVPKNYFMAVTWYSTGALHGNVEAAANLHRMTAGEGATVVTIALMGLLGSS